MFVRVKRTIHPGIAISVFFQYSRRVVLFSSTQTLAQAQAQGNIKKLRQRKRKDGNIYDPCVCIANENQA